MPSILVNGSSLETNDEGYLVNIDDWTEEVAAALASTEQVDNLTEDHWQVVNYIRDFYLKNKTAPMVRKICKTTGFKLKQIYQFFPTGPAKGAAKVAGLPKPDGCV